MDKIEIHKKIASCKALQGKTIGDVCMMDEFMVNLKAYIEAQREDRRAIRSSYQAMKKVGSFAKFKLPAHPIDKLMDLSTGQFRDEYMKVIDRTSKLPAAERQYIGQLGMQAYNLTTAQIICREFPELEDVLIPKSKAN